MPVASHSKPLCWEHSKPFLLATLKLLVIKNCSYPAVQDSIKFFLHSCTLYPLTIFSAPLGPSQAPKPLNFCFYFSESSFLASVCENLISLQLVRSVFICWLQMTAFPYFVWLSSISLCVHTKFFHSFINGYILFHIGYRITPNY